MPYTDFARNSAAIYLSVVDWFTTPLRVLARSSAANSEEQEVLQQEVWDEWAKQPEPYQGLIFG